LRNLGFLLWLKIAAATLIGMCVVILLSVNKFSASVVLTVTAVVIVLPKTRSRALTWGRIAFVVVAFALVAWNISTTEYMDCYATESRFLDQLQHIFDGFLKNVFGVGPCRG
jgi:hypothetical protein